ncbi:MAG: ABC transporter permease, partial [Clostridiales bacterium]|nr:ABC transporter permease [Clostridiales bacterium]
YTPFVYLGIGLCIVMGIYLKYTRAGLNLRAVGENPAVADAAGINVTAVKYVNILMGGGICALGGAHISLVLCGGVWVQDLIGGLGWISVALVIFSSWNPFLCILGASVFGGFQILKFYMPAVSLPDAFYSMLPFLMTALVLVISSMRKNNKNVQPASCGVNYFREER